MSDHFDHYKRPPSRDNSVDRYSRAASRLSGGSRQSSVERSNQQLQQQQQQQPEGRPSFGVAGPSSGGGHASGRVSYVAPKAGRQPPPFEDVILRQRNIGQEIVPSPVGQPKRTESLFVNPNAARRDHAARPKVSRRRIPDDEYCGCIIRSPSASSDSDGCINIVPPQPAVRRPRLLPTRPPLIRQMANLQIATTAVARSPRPRSRK